MRRAEQGVEVALEAAFFQRVERLHEVDALVVPVIPEVGDQGFQAHLLAFRHGVAGLLHELDLHVGVAHGAEGIGDARDFAFQRLELLRREHVHEDAQRGAQAAGGDTHVVQGLDVVAVARARQVAEHLVELQTERRGRRVAECRVRGNIIRRLRHSAAVILTHCGAFVKTCRTLPL